MKYHDDILQIITDKGPQGVTALAKELNAPSSSIQKYLEKQQNYFKRNVNRKWDLPENVDEEHQNTLKTTQTAMLGQSVASQANMLKEQIEVLLGISDTLAHQADILSNSVVNAKTAQPVAKAPELPKLIQDTLTSSEMLIKLVKQQMSNIPEVYQDMLTNVNWVRLLCNEGTKYFDNEVSPELSPILTGESTTFTDEIRDVLLEYQKKDN